MRIARIFILFLFGLVITPELVSAQSADIKELESEIPGYSGRRQIRQIIKLSKMYADEGFYDKAYEVARKGYRTSKDKHYTDYQALSLHQGARVYIDKPNHTRKELETAKKDLLVAAALVEGSDLNKIIMENDFLLNQCEREMAVMSGKEDKEGEAIATITDLFKSRKDKHDVPDEVSTNENEDNGTLAPGQPSSGSQGGDQSIEKEKSLNNNQRSFFLAEIAKQRKAIENMSSTQLQQQLLLLKQGTILDSMRMSSYVDSLRLSQSEYENAEKDFKIKERDNELALKKSETRVLWAIIIIVLLLGSVILVQFFNTRKFNRTLREKNDAIAAEKERSDELLLNILPQMVATELKENGKAAARKYNKVTVLFTDFKNFSKIAENLTPEQLVDELDFCFRKFDEIVIKYGLEKIKTIGDSYMCAGGLPEPDSVAPEAVVHAAMDMQKFLAEWKEEQMKKGSHYFEARIGIHTGPLVAGVVGSKKFAYDIWGDTVNIASRMESSGEPGKVNISEATFKSIKDSFKCTYRGKIEAKNKGEIDMYFVDEEISG